MIAIGVNDNNHIFLLAFAIIENESYNRWYSGILKVVNEHGSPWLEAQSFHILHVLFVTFCQQLPSQVSQLTSKSFNLPYRKSESSSQVLIHHGRIGKVNAQARQWLKANSLLR
uniref:Uncharacterized protein n=1 Tax=Lactuca sativa TaxID=4236 RepID=A0A9R1V6Q4_LACSA|nr:hypothetical protein LSAT_V11C600299110 [Lactuca sativa]